MSVKDSRRSPPRGDPGDVRVVGWKRAQVLGTRLHLIETALGLFGERGYADTPLEQVVRRAGLTRGALYHHFADKRALFEAVLDQLLWDVVNEVDRRVVKRAVERGEEREADAVEMLVEELGRPVRQRIICVDGPAVLGHARWSELLSTRLLEPLRRLVSPVADAGALAPALVPTVSRLLFAAVVEAALLVGRAEPATGAATRAEIDAALAWLFQRALRDPVQDKQA